MSERPNSDRQMGRPNPPAGSHFVIYGTKSVIHKQLHQRGSLFADVFWQELCLGL